MKLYKLLLSLSVGLLALNVSAQNRTVTGTVTDGENGDPVPFASIVVKGTSNWTTTDIDGKVRGERPLQRRPLRGNPRLCQPGSLR